MKEENKKNCLLMATKLSCVKPPRGRPLALGLTLPWPRASIPTGPNDHVEAAPPWKQW